MNGNKRENVFSMKVAVVTGSSRGLGREIALTLLHSGFTVVGNYHRSGESEAGADISPFPSLRADVSDSRQVQEMAENVYRTWGRIDVLVNNAGITRDGLLLRCADDEWDRVMRVNLKGCFNTIRSFSALMARSGGGHIVNIASRSGVRGKAGQAAYSISKASLIGFSQSAARELSEQNIRVNCVVPGYLPTAMGRSAPGALEQARQESLLHCLGDPRETAQFIACLVTTRGVTGQVFSLDSRV